MFHRPRNTFIDVMKEKMWVGSTKAPPKFVSESKFYVSD